MKKLTQEDVINRFIVVHGNYYDYSKVKYHLAYTDVTIICPRHGEFQQGPNSHVRGAGCNKCAIEFSSKTFSREKVKDVYGDILALRKKMTDAERCTFEVGVYRQLPLCQQQGALKKWMDNTRIDMINAMEKGLDSLQ